MFVFAEVVGCRNVLRIRCTQKAERDRIRILLPLLIKQTFTNVALTFTSLGFKDCTRAEGVTFRRFPGIPLFELLGNCLFFDLFAAIRKHSQQAQLLLMCTIKQKTTASSGHNYAFNQPGSCPRDAPTYARTERS